MASNRRIFYAVQAVGIAPNGTTSFTSVHGLQSVGMNTRFNLEQVFEIGQLSIYQNVENLPDIEMTMEKVLDGYPLLYHMTTQGAPDASLVGRSNQRATVALSIFGDTQVSASGTPIQQCTCSGMYLSSVTYDIKVEGASTESITTVGNNKLWLTAGTGVTFTYSGGFNNTDQPLAPEGCNYRQNLVMASCRFPKNIPGINGSGINTVQSDGSYAVHFQSIRISANLGREQLLELGHKAPYFRYINFPVEIRIDFEIINTIGDNISATEEGVFGNGNNVGSGDHIFVQMQEGLKVDCGTKAVLSSVNYGGANAGARGGNAATTYSYTTFNDFRVTHPQDPTVALQE